MPEGIFFLFSKRKVSYSRKVRKSRLLKFCFKWFNSFLPFPLGIFLRKIGRTNIYFLPFT